MRQGDGEGQGGVRRPVMLDLFAGAGGMAAGYHRAGWDVIGVDCAEQPNYPFAFHCLDWREGLERFGASADAVHSSPPCQHYSPATAWRGDRSAHPDLIDEVRAALAATGKPYVIETVEGGACRLRFPLMLCGSLFGLRVRRHRYFECPSLPLILTPDCRHAADDYSFDHGGKQPESVYRDAMGCHWMTVEESRQAIPPAYGAFIGARLLASLEGR